ncbi:MAG: polyhydroxyalkanoic acid system family protein [Pseudomonadota bacterium]
MKNIRVEKEISKNLSKEEFESLILNIKESRFKDYDFDYTWSDDDNISFKGKGFSGSLEKNKNIISINLSFGFLLIPFKNLIKEGIEAELDKI